MFPRSLNEQYSGIGVKKLYRDFQFNKSKQNQNFSDVLQ